MKNDRYQTKLTNLAVKLEFSRPDVFILDGMYWLSTIVGVYEQPRRRPFAPVCGGFRYAKEMLENLAKSS